MLASREALDLARELVEEMLAADEASWRRRWFAALAALRTTYDVLKDVDKNNPRLSAHIGPVLAERVDGKRRKPDILFVFIKDTANSLLHGFRFDVDREIRHGPLVTRAGVSLVTRGGTPLVSRQVRFTCMKEPLKGKDGRALLSEAYVWLDEILSEVEASAAIHRPPVLEEDSPP